MLKNVLNIHVCKESYDLVQFDMKKCGFNRILRINFSFRPRGPGLDSYDF